MRYKAMPGSAQRTKASADSIWGGNCNRSLNICRAVMPMAATRVDCVTNKNNGDSKQRATSREIAGRLRTGDKSRDGVIESEEPQFCWPDRYSPRQPKTFPRQPVRGVAPRER